MKSIIYVGMDVHKSSFTLCSMKAQFGLDDVFFAHVRINPEAVEHPPGLQLQAKSWPDGTQDLLCLQ